MCLSQKFQFLYVKHYIGCSARSGVGPSTFPDDTTGFASDSDINNVQASLNRELVGVDNWLKLNRLSLNVSKTSYMIISNQKNALDIKIRE